MIYGRGVIGAANVSRQADEEDDGDQSGEREHFGSNASLGVVHEATISLPHLNLP